MDIFSTGYTSTAFLADASAGAQDTFASLGPVLGVVIGIVLAFIIAPKLVGLFKKAGSTK